MSDEPEHEEDPVPPADEPVTEIVAPADAEAAAFLPPSNGSVAIDADADANADAPAEPVVASPPVPEPTPTVSASDASFSRPAGTAADHAPAAAAPADRPEVIVGAAFAGGLVFAMILKRFGR